MDRKQENGETGRGMIYPRPHVLCWRGVRASDGTAARFVVVVIVGRDTAGPSCEFGGVTRVLTVVGV